MLPTKYQGSRPYGFRQEYFYMFFSILEFTGFQLDWNSLRTKCPSSPNIVRTFGNFLGHFFRHSFYHHKPKMLSALLLMKTGVVLLPFRMIGAAWLIGWLFFNEETGASVFLYFCLVIGGSGWGTVFFAAIFGRCTTR